MTGTFNITLNGKTTEVSANTDSQGLRKKLLEVGLSPQATVIQKGWNIMTRSYIVYFNDQKGQQNLIQVDKSNLVSYDNSKLKVKVERVRTSSKD